MNNPSPHPSQNRLYRLAYEAPHFFAPHLSLTFLLDPIECEVTARFTLKENRDNRGSRVILNGSRALTLQSIAINGEPLDLQSLTWIGEDLQLTGLNDGDQVEIVNQISPEKNDALTGLFITDGLYCSDCEPQGFRHITYFLDRPDNMATYDVRLIAPKSVPQLLSNGNLIETGEWSETHHYAHWQDPFPKPTYLFALVAGDLAYIEDYFPRRSGNPVRLRIYANHAHIEQCHFALQALKNAMKWDEERYQLICDLDHYNIVAVNDFNGGAMENKGLNIFNSQYIFADEAIATDHDFRWIEAVIGHEYFHNWTGNRITCRDWFNLSLKEGLTVFREQEFIADRYHRGLKRIEDVQLLRRHQFPEDQGALSHPVRPDSVQSIENLYTTTIYEKGAEIVRLYQTILGQSRFDQGLAHYIESYDGQAVTTDQFLSSMEWAYGRSLPNFDRWYSQAGTPQLMIESDYDPITQILRLSLNQRTPDGCEKYDQAPVVIPIRYAFLNQDGSMPLEETFILQERRQCLLFHNVTEKPIISFLRGFSAPVELHYAQSLTDLRHIIQYESDHYARWNAAQQFYQTVLLSHGLIEEKSAMITPLFRHLLDDAKSDPHFTALLLTLPTLNELLPLSEEKAVDQLRSLLYGIKYQLATSLAKEWQRLDVSIENDSAEKRALRGVILEYRSLIADKLINDEPNGVHSERIDDQTPSKSTLLAERYHGAESMTERDQAIRLAIQYDDASLPSLIAHFHQHYHTYPTVLDRWFSLQADHPTLTTDQLTKLLNHPDFSWRTPNRVRAVLGTYIRNASAFKADLMENLHWFLTQLLNVDRLNPQTAARLITPLSREENFNPKEQRIIHTLLSQFCQEHSLSPNLKEQCEAIIKGDEDV